MLETGELRRRGRVETLMVMRSGGRREDAAACAQTVLNAVFLPCAVSYHVKPRALLC